MLRSKFERIYPVLQDKLNTGIIETASVTELTSAKITVTISLPVLG